MISSVLLYTLAQATPVEASWHLDDGTPHRWLVETAIDFPGHAFVRGDQNLDVRAHHLGLRAIVDCEAVEPRRSRGELRCVIEDAAWSGATFQAEQGLLQPVLDELDAKLTGAPLSILLTEHGQVRGVDLVPHEVSRFENRRTRRTDVFLRMIVVRALAPLDLRIPEGGFPTTETWVDGRSLALAMPVTWGSSARGRLVHTATPHDDTRVLVQSEGQATMVPGGFLSPGGLILDANLQGFTVFDHASGRVSEAMWTTWATPTATSGPLARPYTVRSALRALADDEAVPLGPNQEYVTPGT